jgi:hypothetical protein
LKIEKLNLPNFHSIKAYNTPQKSIKYSQFAQVSATKQSKSHTRCQTILWNSK